MRKKIVVAIVAIAVIVGAYFGYKKYQEHKLIEELSPIVKMATIKTEYIMGNGASGMSYEDIFKAIDKSINEIDKGIEQTKLKSNEKNKEITAPAVEYLEGCAAYLRAAKSFYYNDVSERIVTKAFNTIKDEDDNTGEKVDLMIEYVKKLRTFQEDGVRLHEDFLRVTSKILDNSQKLRQIFRADVLLSDKTEKQGREFISDSNKTEK